MRKKLSTTQVARLLGASHQSIANWIDQGKLRAGKTPGGHRRIERDDLVVFLRQQNLRIPPELSSAGATVLIVDDDPGVGDLLSDAIRSFRPDARTLVACDGFAAGECVTAEHPDVVLLDLYMPGLDGFEVCRRIKSNPATRRIHVIAVTAHPSPEAEQTILEAGAVACLPKPIDLDQLQKLIESALSGRL